MSNERRAPVQGAGIGYRGCSVPAGTVDWSEHLEAWKAYERCGHGSQSAERVAERGGFCFFELSTLLGRAPTTWEPRS